MYGLLATDRTSTYIYITKQQIWHGIFKRWCGKADATVLILIRYATLPCDLAQIVIFMKMINM